MSSFFSWIANAAGSALERIGTRSGRKKRELSSFIAPGPGSGLFAGAWTDSRLEQVRHFRHWVFVAVERLADRVASQAVNVGRLIHSEAEPAKRYLNYPARRKALTPLRGRHDLEPVDDDHQLVRLLSDPNEPDVAYDLWYETVLFLKLTGSAYWWLALNKSTGLPEAIWVLPSHWVWPVFGKDKLIEAYEIRPTEGNYLRQVFPAEEIIHFKRKNTLSKIDGYSPLSAISQWIDIQESVDRSRYHTHKNGAFPMSAIEFDPAYHDPSEEDLNRIEAKFMARYAGEIKAGRPLLLPPGVKYHKLSVTPREMDYGQTSEQVRDSILAAFGVPASIAGLTKGMTYGSLMADHVGFAVNTINPLLRWMGQIVTEKLARRFSPDLRVWWDDTTPDDPQLLETQLKTDMASGSVTPNEVRMMRGRRPYQYGGDDPIIASIGLVLPWGTGDEKNAINPFDRSSKDSESPSKSKPEKESEDSQEEDSEDES